jgi:hypothetical protein
MKRHLIAILCAFVMGCSRSGQPSKTALGDLINNPKWDRVSLNERDERIRSCMAFVGFKYFPTVITIRGTRRPSQDSADPDMLRRRGYGVTDSMLGLDQLVLATTEDPRLTAYVHALSRVDARAFWSAMYGADLAEQASKSEVEPKPGIGCVGKAGTRRTSTLQTRLQAGLNTMEDRLRADSRVTKLTAAWRDCMRKQGHRYRDRYEIVNGLMNRLGPIMSNGGVSTAEFSKLGTDERQISFDDAACWDHEYQEYLRIRSTYEARFREENATDLKTASAQIGE